MRSACLLALACLLLAGCATLGRKPSAGGASAKANAVVPSPSLVVGRIIAVDTKSGSVIVEVGAYAVLPPDFAPRILLARTDDLRPTAHLQSSVYLRGRTLGTRLLDGSPQVGDEVVFAPASP